MGVKRQRREPKLQAQYMIEAWGEDKARKLVMDEIHGRKIGTPLSQWWYDVLGHFPKLPPPPAPPAPAVPSWDCPAMMFMREHGIQGTLARSSYSKSGWVIEFDPMQDKFMAASIIGRSPGSQPGEQGSTPCVATNSGPVV